MNLVDRYPHKRITREYYKNKIDWRNLISLSVNTMQDRSPIFTDETGKSSLFLTGAMRYECTLKFDVTHANPAMIDGLMSENDLLEFYFQGVEYSLYRPYVTYSNVDCGLYGEMILTMEIIANRLVMRNIGG